MNICFSCEKHKQMCNTRTITSEKRFFHKITKFLHWSPEISLKVLCTSRTLGPLGDLQGTSSGSCVPALFFSYNNLFHYNVYHPQIIANHGSFISLKYSLTDLITQHFQENNPLFYDLWSIYHPRPLSRNSNKKVNLLVFFKNCKL